MRESGDSPEILPCPLGSDFHGIGDNGRTENIEGIVHTAKPGLAQTILLPTGDDNIFTICRVFEVLIFPKYSNMRDSARKFEFPFFCPRKHLFVDTRSPRGRLK